MCAIFACFLPLFFLALLSFISLRRDHRKPWQRQRSRLPPGSMGWPYIGETLQLYSQDQNLFFAKKTEKVSPFLGESFIFQNIMYSSNFVIMHGLFNMYGEIFKTNILGYPSVMLASPEAAKFVLSAQAHLFKSTYPKSKETLIGPTALFFHQGDYHARIRKLVQTSLTPESIRALVPGVESIANSTLESWAGGRIINTYTEMKKFSFEVGILAIFGDLSGGYKEELKRSYSQVENGYNSFPTSIPWPPYKKALNV